MINLSQQLNSILQFTQTSSELNLPLIHFMNYLFYSSIQVKRVYWFCAVALIESYYLNFEDVLMHPLRPLKKKMECTIVDQIN